MYVGQRVGISADRGHIYIVELPVLARMLEDCDVVATTVPRISLMPVRPCPVLSASAERRMTGVIRFGHTGRIPFRLEKGYSYSCLYKYDVRF